MRKKKIYNVNFLPSPFSFNTATASVSRNLWFPFRGDSKQSFRGCVVRSPVEKPLVFRPPKGGGGTPCSPNTATVAFFSDRFAKRRDSRFSRKRDCRKTFGFSRPKQPPCFSTKNTGLCEALSGFTAVPKGRHFTVEKPNATVIDLTRRGKKLPSVISFLFFQKFLR